MYLLDTDTFSAIALQRSASAALRLDGMAEGEVAVSVISLAEVQFGIALKPLQARTQARIEILWRLVRQLPLDMNIVPHYAKIRSHLQKQGTPIGPNDLWLAAHALAENLTLVTGNVREFKRVPTLRVENWIG